MTAQTLSALRPWIYGAALRLVRSRDRADDLTQETMLRAWRHRDRFQPGRQPKPWLRRILLNLYFDAGQQPEHVSDEGLEPAVPAQALDYVVLRRLASQIDALPPKWRDVVVLVELDQLSYTAAAQRLGIPIGSVMSRLHRARQKLGLAIDRQSA